MSELFMKLSNINTSGSVSKKKIVNEIKHHMTEHGYNVVEIDDSRPWGAYLRIDNADADSFVAEFFAGLSPMDARLGKSEAKLSPKILVVSPKQRLSWQYHNRRSELWSFLTGGHHHRSMTNFENDLLTEDAGAIIRYAPTERHRLVGRDGDYTMVAEIWQHKDANNLSDEDDIVRVSDDYIR